MATIGQLAGGIAHEINSLLHPIINLSRRVRDSLSNDDAGRRYLEIVLASVTERRTSWQTSSLRCIPHEPTTARSPFSRHP